MFIELGYIVFTELGFIVFTELGFHSVHRVRVP